MSIGNLYLQHSGESGWKEVPNSGDDEQSSYEDGTIIMSIGVQPSGYNATLHPHHLGIGTTGADHKLVVADTGVEANIALRHLSYSHEVGSYNSNLIYTDLTGGHAGHVGIVGNTLNITKFGTGKRAGEIRFNVGGGNDHPDGLTGFAILTSSGNFGIADLKGGFTPEAKIEVVHSGTEISEDITLMYRKDQRATPQFKLTNRGRIGVNTNSPRYTLSVSGDVNSDGTQTGNVGTIFAQSYVYQTSGSDPSKELGSNIVIDLDGPTFRNIELTGDFVTFSTKNRSNFGGEVKAVALKLHAGAYPGKTNEIRYFGFHEDIKFLGVRPSSLISDGVAVLSFNSFGEAESDTVAVYRSSDETNQQGSEGPMGESRQGEPGEGFGNKIIGGDFSTNPWQRLGPEQSGFYDVQSGQFTADRFVFLKSGNAQPNGDVNNLTNWNTASGDIRVNIFRTQVDQNRIGIGHAGYPSGESEGAVPSWTGTSFGAGSAGLNRTTSQLEYPTINSFKVECSSGIGGEYSSLWSGDAWEARTPNVESNLNHAGKYAAIETRIEGYNARELMSKVFTLSFYAKTTRGGHNTVYLKNANSTATYIQPYELCDTGVWKEFNIPFFPFGTPFATRRVRNLAGVDYPPSNIDLPVVYDDVSGLNLEDGIGLRIGWVLGAAADLRVPEGKSGMWHHGDYYTWSGTRSTGDSLIPVNHLAIPSDVSPVLTTPSFSLANVSVNVGHLADSRSALRSVQQEHQLCKRYFERLDLTSGQCVGVGMSRGNNPPSGTGINIKYDEKIRIPTISGSGVFATSSPAWEKGGVVNITTGMASKNMATIGFTGNVEDMSFANGNAVGLWASGHNDNYIWVDAELNLPEDEII